MPTSLNFNWKAYILSSQGHIINWYKSKVEKDFQQ